MSLATLNIIPANYSPSVFAMDRFKVWNGLYNEWLNLANNSTTKGVCFVVLSLRMLGKGISKNDNQLRVFFFPSISPDSSVGALPCHPPAPHPAPCFFVGPLSLSLPHLAFTITLTSEGIRKCLQTAHFSKRIKIKGTQNLSLKGKENHNSFSVFRHHSPNNCYMQFKFLNRCGMGLDMEFRLLLLLIIFLIGGENTLRSAK